ncbi:biotin/lipoyl-containing protein [Megasphaera elsdenii]|uniref:biotin/lipoyl-containing protein n=1 Tax=Megasphaera elsdenii TaxID=907 RepID=UPI003FEEDEC0
MKKFKITVNGKAYEVEVEEMGGTPVAAPAPQASAPAPAPAAPAPAPAAPASTPAPAAPASTPAPAVGGPIPDGAITVKAPMPGKISALKAEAGKAVKRGDIILVLEAMKMQNDITATADGTLHEIRVNPGDNVKTGDVLAVIVK